jgi:hypothetical protein
VQFPVTVKIGKGRGGLPACPNQIPYVDFGIPPESLELLTFNARPHVVGRTGYWQSLWRAFLDVVRRGVLRIKSEFRNSSVHHCDCHYNANAGEKQRASRTFSRTDARTGRMAASQRMGTYFHQNLNLRPPGPFPRADCCAWRRHLLGG